MANPPGMDEWLKYVDANARTPQEREQMRADVYKRFGVEPPKRKRGGLAGLYDRNKGLIQAAVPTLAGMLIPGSALVSGAIAGGLARGLDRPGKGGIGLDLGQAAQGALTGAALGQAGRYLGGKVGVGPGAVPKVAAAPAATTAPQDIPAMLSDADYKKFNVIGADKTAPSVAGNLANTVSGTTPPAGASKLAGLLKPEAIGGITAGLGQAVGGYMEREAAGERLDFEKEQRELEQQRANRLAQLLAPMAGAQAGMVGAQYGGYGRMG